VVSVGGTQEPLRTVNVFSFAEVSQKVQMDDPHQVMTIIATAISDARNATDGRPLDPEEAKQIAKCICEALSDAGLQIVLADRTEL
jgi:hypothetical protein